MKNYITIKDISKIYNISQKIVNMILRNHKIDSFKSKKWLVINFKDFHKVYTSTYNPSLFFFDEKNIPRKWNDNIIIVPKFADDESLFHYIFSKPYKRPNKKLVLKQNFLFD